MSCSDRPASGRCCGVRCGPCATASAPWATYSDPWPATWRPPWRRLPLAATRLPLAAAADDAFAALLPVRTHRCEATTALVEGAAGDPVACRVERLAAAAGCTTRQLQRRFADHVGIGPKAVLRRYRLFEAAERARSGCHVDWSAVAADLGYSDQAHLTRDFSASFGVPPGRYLQLNRT